MDSYKEEYNLWWNILLKQTKAYSLLTVLCDSLYTLKKKIENNSTWEGAFYQSEWVKSTQVELF